MGGANFEDLDEIEICLEESCTQSCSYVVTPGVC